MKHSMYALIGLLLLVPAAAAADKGKPVAPAKRPSSSEVADLGTRKQGVDWPGFLGPTGDSKSPETGILHPWPDKGLRLVWKRDLGIGYGGPAISRGRLFQCDRQDDQARITCLRSETGEELWKFEYRTDYEDLYGYNNGPRCCPVVDGERVYMFGAEGMLHCLRVTDGSLVWKIDTAAKFGVIQNFFGVGSTPVVEGELLIVQIGGSPEESKQAPPGALDQVIPNGTGIVAFDKRTGEVRYQLADELASYASPVLATVGGRRWCLVFARGGLLGFNPTTGKEEFHYDWRAPILESVNAANPVVVGDKVFISETYGPGSSLLKFQPGGCEVIWKDEARQREKKMQTHWNTPLHLDGYLYASSGRHDYNAELRCIELATGAVQWSVPNLTRTSLTYADGHLLGLGEYGDLFLLRVNPEKYDLVSSLVIRDGKLEAGVPGEGDRPLLRNPFWAAPVLSHGLLYVRGDNRLFCLELIPEKR